VRLGLLVHDKLCMSRLFHRYYRGDRVQVDFNSSEQTRIVYVSDPSLSTQSALTCLVTQRLAVGSQSRYCKIYCGCFEAISRNQTHRVYVQVWVRVDELYRVPVELAKLARGDIVFKIV
jgi:hypothetical protein